MNDDTLKKLVAGSGLTDGELNDALLFFANLESSLALLGEKFYLAHVEVIRILESLKSARFNRDRWK